MIALALLACGPAPEASAVLDLANAASARELVEVGGLSPHVAAAIARGPSASLEELADRAGDAEDAVLADPTAACEWYVTQAEIWSDAAELCAANPLCWASLDWYQWWADTYAALADEACGEDAS